MPKILTLKDHLTKDQLRRKYLNCHHPQEKVRWQALSSIAEGGIANQVTKQLGKSSGWISETVQRYNEGGVAAVKNQSKNQRSKTLTEEQVKELEKLIESGKTPEGRLWTATEIKRWVKAQTAHEIHKTTAWRMFAKLKFSRQTPRPAHQKRASGQDQEEFKKS